MYIYKSNLNIKYNITKNVLNTLYVCGLCDREHTKSLTVSILILIIIETWNYEGNKADFFFTITKTKLSPSNDLKPLCLWCLLRLQSL